ncbi:MAG: hypothetical protein JXX29_10620 [Deltaproteobacteria bacterium]|nr:hypothetical protein [Deltaproteobacteria bacterium]MBN2672121.1 hypothetical protein [Deltaproteobacteria bacterium]
MKKRKQLLLQVGPHCIETAARRARDTLELALLESDERSISTEDVATFELLTKFLSRTDFRRLRSENAGYRGEVPQIVIVVEDETGLRLHFQNADASE